MGTPHRFQSTDDLEDQLCKLVLLPGPKIRGNILNKAKELARQVIRVNQRFLATKIPDRAAIFNLFAQITRKSQKPNPVDENTAGAAAPSLNGREPDDDVADPVTPFPPYAHHLGHSFEAAGTNRQEDVDHVALIRGGPSGGPSGEWFSWLSHLFSMDVSRKF